MIFQKTKLPSTLSYIIAQFLFGETPTETTAPEEKGTPPPEQKMIPEAEMKRMLADEWKRAASETRAAVLKETEAKIISEDTLKELGYKSIQDLLDKVRSADDQKGKKGSEAKGEVKPEEVKALESQFQTEIERREQEIEKQTREKETLKAALETEKIDNVLKFELATRRASSADLIVLSLKQFVQMDDNLSPVVVNEKGEPRMKIEEYTEDGVKRFRTDAMTIPDLVEEFLQQEENQHFLPASRKEGSGAGGILPTSQKVAKETQYKQLKEELQKTGDITPEFMRLQRELFGAN